MLYQIDHASVSLGGESILKDICMEIRGDEKIAIVGKNGTGKSTLLKLIAGELTPDRDDRYSAPAVRTSRRILVDMLRQTAVENQNETVEEHLLREYVRRIGAETGDDLWMLTDRERYDFEAEYDRLFTGFGFDAADKKRPLGEFSGGQQTKIAMIRLLLSKPDILLLDEPTNHLDTASIEWLENYLREYPKAVVIVSHDRYFLDQTVQTIYELRKGRLTRYPGNYSSYRMKKAADYSRSVRAYTEQQEEIQRLKDLILRFRGKPSKAAFARSRQKILDRMVMLDEPDPQDAPRHIPSIMPAHGCSKWVWEGEHLKFGYDKPIHELSLRIRRGSKIGVLGPNGSGKTTLLKTICGRIPSLEGKMILGNGVEMGVYDQDSAAIQSDLNVLEYYRERFPGISEKDARHVLGIYGFSGKDSGKTVSCLSGGEKTRLVIALMLQSAPNVLVLDEPTNHMDVEGLEMLEECLKAYQGTVIMVSHDRYFLDRTVSSLLIFPDDDQQELVYYPFGYDHYRRRMEKGTKAEDLPAARTAEEQALIEGLRAVPKGESRRLREIPTERAYEDWRFRLLREQLDEAEDNWLQNLRCREEERFWVDGEYASFIEQRIDKACRRVTDLYVEWYELLCEFNENEE